MRRLILLLFRIENNREKKRAETDVTGEEVRMSIDACDASDAVPIASTAKVSLI